VDFHVPFIYRCYIILPSFGFSPRLLNIAAGLLGFCGFLPLLRLRAQIIPATLRNAAGIVGVAAIAAETARKRG
jgi:hypothetical protein